MSSSKSRECVRLKTEYKHACPPDVENRNEANAFALWLNTFKNMDDEPLKKCYEGRLNFQDRCVDLIDYSHYLVFEKLYNTLKQRQLLSGVRGILKPLEEDHLNLDERTGEWFLSSHMESLLETSKNPWIALRAFARYYKATDLRARDVIINISALKYLTSLHERSISRLEAASRDFGNAASLFAALIVVSEPTFFYAMKDTNVVSLNGRVLEQRPYVTTDPQKRKDAMESWGNFVQEKGLLHILSFPGEAHDKWAALASEPTSGRIEYPLNPTPFRRYIGLPPEFEKVWGSSAESNNGW